MAEASWHLKQKRFIIILWGENILTLYQMAVPHWETFWQPCHKLYVVHTCGGHHGTLCLVAMEILTSSWSQSGQASQSSTHTRGHWWKSQHWLGQWRVGWPSNSERIPFQKGSWRLVNMQLGSDIDGAAYESSCRTKAHVTACAHSKQSPRPTERARGLIKQGRDTHIHPVWNTHLNSFH